MTYYKVVDAVKNGDTINTGVIVSLVDYRETIIRTQEIYDNSKLYKFNFKEYNGGYVLMGITGITE